MKKFSPFKLIVVLSLILTSCSSTVAAPSYAAQVNGQTISRSALYQELSDMKNNKAYVSHLQSMKVIISGIGKKSYNNGFVAQVLTREIYWSLISQYLKTHHIAVTSQDKTKAVGQVTSQVGNAAIFHAFPVSYQQTLVNNEANLLALENYVSSVSKTQASTYYSQHQAMFANSCVRHILVKTKSKALQLRKQILSGAHFSAVAKANSIDTGSAKLGGSLGCKAGPQYVTPFQKAVDHLPVNKISQPVHSQFGWHLIEVTKRTPQSLAQSMSKVISYLKSQKANKFSSFLKASKIKVNPRFGKFVNSPPNSFGVVPPKTPTSSQAPSSSGSSSSAG